MTKIELLFMEYRRQEAIRFEEFSNAGWSVEEYLTYLHICEELRATSICLQELNNKIVDTTQNIKLWKETLFSAVVNRLSNWLSNYFEKPLTLGWKPEALEFFISYMPCFPFRTDEKKKYCSLIYTSSDEFRYQIERIITLVILNDYGQFAGDNTSILPVEHLGSIVCRNERRTAS
jgi:hypothetical protein